MKLILSSSAAPDAPLEALAAAAVRRGFAGLELEEGHGHGLDPRGPTSGAVGAPPAREARRLAREAGAPIVACRLRKPRPAGSVADLARLLDVPVLLTPSEARRLGPQDPPPDLRLLLVTTGAREEMPALRDAVQRLGPGAGVSWTVDASASAEEPAAVFRRLREAVDGRLGHVRLAGGGPESASQEGRGIGALVAHLALSGFVGPVTLAPSSHRYRVIWSAWLGRRGGWGCGGKGGEPDLVSLGATGGSP